MTYPAPTLSLSTLTDDHRPSNPGAQAVTNYDFSAGTAGWTPVNSATLSESGGVLRVAYNGVNNPGVSQTFMTAGDRYANRGIKIRSDGAVTYTVKLGGSVYWVGTTSTDWKEISFPLTALGTDVEITTDATSAGYVEIDYIDIPVVSAAAIDSIAANNAVLGDGATPATMPTKLTDIGYRFDSDTEYMRVTNPAANSQLFGISCFIKVPAGGLTTTRSYLNIQDGTNRIIQFFGITAGRFFAYIGPTPQIIATSAPNQASDIYGRWYHFYIGQNATATVMYRDGELVSTTGTDTLVYSNQDLWIGQRWDQVQKSRCDMTMIQFSKNYCHTADEVVEIRREGLRFMGRRFFI